MNYVVITAARNEERVIGNPLESMVAQIVPPLRWVIVDDGSIDATPELVQRYAAQHPWIELVRRPARADRSFSGKAHAINTALQRVSGLPFEVVVNLDADVSFGPDYFEFLLPKFREDPRLGVAGTPFTEAGGYDSVRDSFEGQNFVAGPCQLFRRTCWEEIGGYVPHRAGGVDWIAVMTARMKGWEVRAFPEKRFHHHRSMGTAERGLIRSAFSYGEKDYYLGGSPLWQLFRCAYRMTKRPVIGGGLALLAGYTSAALRGMPRAVTPELMRFHRAEQMKKLRLIFGKVARGRRVNAFTLTDGRAPES